MSIKSRSFKFWFGGCSLATPVPYPLVCIPVHVSNKYKVNRFITETGKLVLYLRFSHLWILNCGHMMEGLLHICWTTQHHIPQQSNICSHRHENLKSNSQLHSFLKIFGVVRLLLELTVPISGIILISSTIHLCSRPPGTVGHTQGTHIFPKYDSWSLLDNLATCLSGILATVSRLVLRFL